MPHSSTQTTASGAPLQGLSDRSAYPHPVSGPVVLNETHISRIFLAGPYAYKTKKPCVTEFLDYGSLEARRAACEKELRLNRRYAPDLYLAVVPITLTAGQPRVEGEGEAVEYAVKMHRFPDDALLSERLRRGDLRVGEVHQLAETVAAFHSAAAASDPQFGWGSPARVREDALGNFQPLQSARIDSISATLSDLLHWTEEFFDAHASRFAQRVSGGFIRECHGDLHLANVIQWHNRLIPFDGIEFNEGFRWIDILSDAAFLAMDFAARGQLALGRSFTSAYLDHTGDHSSLQLWRWYLVYRALVRAKVAAMREGQPEVAAAARTAAARECREHVALARRFTAPEPLRLWITHGLSGSGKTTGSETLVQRTGAIRIRSDIERKRLYGVGPKNRPDRRETEVLYSELAGQRTYDRLLHLASLILRAGYSVIVDAAFLETDRRQRFRDLARREGAAFAILDFDAAESTLRQRVAERMARGRDASDASVEVLERQLASQQPLTAEERASVVEIPGAG